MLCYVIYVIYEYMDVKLRINISSKREWIKIVDKAAFCCIHNAHNVSCYLCLAQSVKQG